MTGTSVHSHSTTIHAMRNQVGYKVRNMVHYGQPSIEIELDGHKGPKQSWVTSYSTMDSIHGSVAITAQHDTRFEDIDIAFVGTSQVYVDRLATTPTMSGRTEATHRFLLLRQPVDEADFPAPRIFEAGRTYRFPFTFTIPTQLLPRACGHKTSSDHVRDQHLMLPPSLGDPDLAGFGSSLLDDLAPEMSKVIYAIKVKIAHQRSEGICVLAEKSRKIRIKPAFEEQPPLNIDGNDEYRAKQEKTVKKGLFKGKAGTLTAQTAQPKPLIIPGARTTDNEIITSSAKVVLRFDPTDEDAVPPQMSSLTSRLKIVTYYASAPRQSFPSRASLGFDITQGMYAENVALSSLCIASATWQKHTSASNPPPTDPLERRDSGISDCSSASTSASTSAAAFASGILPPSSSYKKGTFYTAQILVPLALPLTKNFIPTFHSCLISRVYVLGLQLSAHGGPGISLKVPVQICAMGSDSGIENARVRSVEEVVRREVSDVFRPRSVVALPSRSAGAGGEELPPEYAAFGPSGRRVTARVSMIA